ncbi:MAG: hypothetical protein JWO58_3313 [Chitinophagaceae bacterium]|nr:hypothetical protein [Chitinophagaceae bacterium]
MQKTLKKIKQLIPPVVLNFCLKNIGYIGLAPWEYMPEGFSYRNKSKGWDLESIVQLQLDKWPKYAERVKSTASLGFNHESADISGNTPFFHNLLVSFAYVLTLASLNKKEIRFLDWGGGIGHYGLLAEELLKPVNLDFNYYCYDFEVFEKTGKQINLKYNYFHDNDKYYDVKFDIIMASSSIWYEENWKNGIDKPCKYDTDFLYITRMIFISNTPSYVAIQRPKHIGYNTEYLFWIINKHEFIAYVTKKGFSLIREFEFGEATPIFKAPEQGTMQGFLFKKA